MHTPLCPHFVPDHTPFSSCFWIRFHWFSYFLGWWPKSQHMRPYESCKISKGPLILKTPLENQTELTRPIHGPQLLLHMRVFTVASKRCNLMCPITYPHSSHPTGPFSSILRGWLLLALFFQLAFYDITEPSTFLTLFLCLLCWFPFLCSTMSSPQCPVLLHSLSGCNPLLLVRLSATGWTCVSCSACIS